MTEMIKVPLLPESVNDATVSKWLHDVGDTIEEGDVIAELETDKIMLEVPANQAGVITEILKPEGSQVKADEVLCVLNSGAQVDQDQTNEANEQASSQTDAANSDDQPKESELSAIELVRSEKNKLKKGPSARKILREKGIDENNIITDQPDRISPDDVHRHLGATTESGDNDSHSSDDSDRSEHRVPMTRLRQTIAKRLMQSQHETASLTTFNEVDLSKVMELRSRYKDDFIKKYGVKLGFMSFFTKACCRALQAFPEVNASVDGQDILYHNYCDIGIAVSTEKGLLVPIIRDAQQLDMAGVEAQILEYAQRAKENKISLDDLTGGTFSITNGGVFGSMLSTPILNPPQSAILGMHNIVNRPVAVDNSIVIRPMMYLALTYDHRIIDGSQAVRFLVMIKTLLEDPDRLLLQI